MQNSKANTPETITQTLDRVSKEIEVEMEYDFEKDQKTITEAMSLLDKDGKNNLKLYLTDLDEMGETHNYRIENEPIEGEFQFECGLEIVVNQHVGYVCDDYYGTISIQLADKKYLLLDYSC